MYNWNIYLGSQNWKRDQKPMKRFLRQKCPELFIGRFHTMSLLNPIENIMEEKVSKEVSKTFRVPLFKKQDMFIIWTGSGTVRYFQQDTLPDVIKIKLGIIMASPHAAELNTKEMSNTDFEQSNVQSEVYISKFGKDYEDIGWQYNRYYYCVVLTDEELKSLQG